MRLSEEKTTFPKSYDPYINAKFQLNRAQSWIHAWNILQNSVVSANRSTLEAFKIRLGYKEMHCACQEEICSFISILC